MTVKEVRERLKQLDQDAEVRVWCYGDHGEFPVLALVEDAKEKCVTITY